jgi:hypothetical protein
MEDQEMFMKLSLAEMSELFARKLTQERESVQNTATQKLEKLEAEMGGLKSERLKLVTEAAYEKIKSLTPEEIGGCNIHSNYLGLVDLEGIEANELVLNVPFEVPDSVKELDLKITALNKSMIMIREDTALRTSRDAVQTKELDLAYLVARMSRMNRAVSAPRAVTKAS